MNNEDIQWITVKGVHIPIKGGEDKYKAVKDFFKKVGYQSGGFGKSIKTLSLIHI